MKLRREPHRGTCDEAEPNALYVDYRTNSTELTLSTWRKRPWYARFIEGLARLTATVQ
jgi:hypothetical protein